MKRRLVTAIVPFVLVPALAAPAPAQDTSAGLTVTYVANEGFLIASGDTKILVDALFAGGIDPYRTLDDERRARMLAGRPPFDGVDLVLVTHEHADHFDAETAISFLSSRDDAILITTPQARARLAGELDDADDPLMTRIRSSLPAEGERETIDHAGITVTTLNLHHGRRRNPTENLGFLLTLGDVTLLHVGDTVASAEEIAANALADEDIDIALLPYWMLTSDQWTDAVTDAIVARSILAMHVPAAHAPANYFAPARDYADLKRLIAERHPNARVPEPGESITIEAAAAPSGD